MQRGVGQRLDLLRIGQPHLAPDFFIAAINDQRALLDNAEIALFSCLIVVIQSKNHELCESRIARHRIDGRRLFAASRAPARIRIHQHGFPFGLRGFQSCCAERLYRLRQNAGCKSESNGSKQECSKCRHKAYLAWVVKPFFVRIVALVTLTKGVTSMHGPSNTQATDSRKFDMPIDVAGQGRYL
jgi:hypothetical protein